MRFDRHRGAWSVVGSASDLCVSDERQVLHDIIASHGQPMTLDDIQQALEKKGIAKEPGTIRVLLTRMVDAGEVGREGRGRYVAKREKLPMLPLLPIRDEVSETTSNNGNGNEGPAQSDIPPAPTGIQQTPSSFSTSTIPSVPTDQCYFHTDGQRVGRHPRGTHATAVHHFTHRGTRAGSRTGYSVEERCTRSQHCHRTRTGQKIRWPKGANAIPGVSTKRQQSHRPSW